jgi:hypothetical protein
LIAHSSNTSYTSAKAAGEHPSKDQKDREDVTGKDHHAFDEAAVGALVFREIILGCGGGTTTVVGMAASL